MEIYLSAAQFVQDFKASYPIARTDILRSTTAAQRFHERMADEAKVIGDCFREVRKHALTAAPAGSPTHQPSGTHPMYAAALKPKA